MTPQRVPFLRRLPVRLAGAILLLGFIAVPVISELKRRAAEQIVLQQAEIQSVTATIAVVEGLQDVLRSVETTARLVARNLETQELSPAELDRVIRNAVAVSPNSCDFSVCLEPGIVGTDPQGRFGHLVSRSGRHWGTRDLAGDDYRYWTRDWYQEALGRGDLAWGEPFFDKGGADANVVRVTVPFYRQHDGQRVPAGVVSAGMDLAWVRRLTEENEFFDSGYVIIFSRAGRIITHPDPSVVFTQTMQGLAERTGNPELAQIYQRVVARRQGSLSYLSNGLHQRVHENYKPVQVAGWGVVVGYQEKEFLAQVSAFRWITMVSLAATLLLLLVIVVAATQLSLRPLERLTAISLEISRGNLGLEIADTGRNDETGHLTRSFRLMLETLRRNRELEDKVRARTEELAAANETLRGEMLERRWVNQALEHQLRYDQLIINSINDMVIVCTKAMNISRVNPAVVRNTGWVTSELINTPLARIVRLQEADGTPGRHKVDPMVQSLRDGRDVRQETGVLVGKDGATTPVLIALFPIRDRDKVVGGVVILQVVTGGSPWI